MTNYRVLKQVDASGNERYRIEGWSEAGVWVLITYRASLQLAMGAIQQIKSQEIVTSEVVYEC